MPGHVIPAPQEHFLFLTVLWQSSSLWSHHVQHLTVFLSSSFFGPSGFLSMHIAFHWLLWVSIVDTENHDANENGAEDDMDKEVNGYDGNTAAKVSAADSEASVNAARVAVRHWLLCFHCRLFSVLSNIVMHCNILDFKLSLSHSPCYLLMTKLDVFYLLLLFTLMGWFGLMLLFLVNSCLLLLHICKR